MAIRAEGNDARISARKAVASGLAAGAAAALSLIPGLALPVWGTVLATAGLSAAARFLSDAAKPRARSKAPGPEHRDRAEAKPQE